MKNSSFSIARRRLDWSKRATTDQLAIVRHYLETASESVAWDCFLEIESNLERIALLGLKFRVGTHDTLECVLKQFPYIIVYRITARTVRVVRVLHQRRAYFNRSQETPCTH